MMKKIILILSFLFYSILSIAQNENKNLKLNIGSTLTSFGDNFEDIFVFNNSRPIIAGLNYSNFRVESIINISLETRDNNQTSVRGSARLSFDYKKNISKKTIIYFGPQYGLHSSKTHLFNLHLGGEFFFHKNWSISNQIELDFLFVNKNKTLILTNNSLLLRFYINIRKQNGL